MVMTTEEIVRDYLQARNKSKQIKVLADLNMVTPAEIRAVLAEAGVEGVEAPKRIVRRKKPPHRAAAGGRSASQRRAGASPGGWAGHLPENREHPRRPARRHGAQSPVGRRKNGGGGVRGVFDGAAEVGGKRRRKAVRLIDADKARDSLNERLKCCNAGSIVEACYLSAIDILDTTPTIAPPPNDPLTMEELREMALEPEPVWCEKFGWRICYGVTDFRGCLCMETGAGNCINLKDYGRTWIAYRRRPEEEN